MVRFFTFLTFLLIILIVACIFFYNSLISAERSIEQGMNDLKWYITDRHALSVSLKELVSPEQKKRLTKIGSAYKKAENSDEKIVADNLFTDFIAELAEQKTIKKEIHTILETIVDLEDSVGSKKRFVDAKASFFNNRIQTFPSSLLAQVSGKKEHSLFIILGEESDGIVSDRKA